VIKKGLEMLRGDTKKYKKIPRKGFRFVAFQYNIVSVQHNAARIVIRATMLQRPWGPTEPTGFGKTNRFTRWC
jgi:hypothetical protein